MSVSSSSSSIHSFDEDDSLVAGLDHINFTVPPNTLPLAKAFYTDVLGFSQACVPNSKCGHLAWFNIGHSGQQLHVTSEHKLNAAQLRAQGESPRHACFKVMSDQKLEQVHDLIWRMYQKGGQGAPTQCDDLSDDNAGRGAGDFPRRFFARDFAGNRLEFTL